MLKTAWALCHHGISGPCCFVFVFVLEFIMNFRIWPATSGRNISFLAFFCPGFSPDFQHQRGILRCSESISSVALLCGVPFMQPHSARSLCFMVIITVTRAYHLISGQYLFHQWHCEFHDERDGYSSSNSPCPARWARHDKDSISVPLSTLSIFFCDNNVS